MEKWLEVAPERPTTDITVDVTFLERLRPPLPRRVVWPEGYRLERWHPNTTDYLALYRLVGAPHCWWMRYLMPSATLHRIIASSHTYICRLLGPEGVAGFFELDLEKPETPYLSYLGLVPEAQGKGLGKRLLNAAIQQGWQKETRVLRVNTCTADHPNALPTYKAAGFVPIMVEQEHWSIPDDLGLVPPEHLRQKVN
ncbi:GNAT family N-acetyltransferase [Asaia spathodeae]|uniref:GNAT family N-acetyltransferase n=1 Tax=Asaia spathodeae TaxID=657016 RepID=A0ABX2P2J2_9PROT|nr:GNAT family N-acetyltransferase [Asaia spathodeae]GBR14549.1 acetyltransferase [Asaia spathodeae NBRC 105894]